MEADAVLISVTAAEPLAAQITAGVQTMVGKGCLHKGQHRNKKALWDAHILWHEHRQNIQHDRENPQHCQKGD